MRITGGEFKGRVIKIPKGIRPTQDKVREAIFNILGDRVKDARFLDLFAGSGAIGIEALSRSAKEVVFVEKSGRILRVLKDNLKSLDLPVSRRECEDKIRIIGKDVLKIVDRTDILSIKGYDIVFADPPYNRGFISKLIPLLPSSSIIILEHSKREEISGGKDYRFGDTILTFL